MSDHSSSILSIVISIFSCLFAIIAFFVARLIKKIDHFDEIKTEWKMIAKDIESLAMQIREYRPALEDVVKTKSSVQAAWKKIDAHEEYLLSLRKRTHELAGYLQKVVLVIHKQHPEIDILTVDLTPITTKKGD